MRTVRAGQVRSVQLIVVWSDEVILRILSILSILTHKIVTAPAGVWPGQLPGAARRSVLCLPLSLSAHGTQLGLGAGSDNTLPSSH